MKKVTAFIGSAHKHNTRGAVLQFFDNLQSQGEVACEAVTLSDYKIGICRGCRVCFEKGEAFCPLRDDRDVLFEKIDASDGVVFATPNYCFQMSGYMKTFIDRFGYIVHRPRFFGKVFTGIVAQGFSGGEAILKNLDFVANTVGFQTVKGATVTGFDPRTSAQQRKADRNLADLSRRFWNMLEKPADCPPSLYQLMFFHIGRMTIKQLSDPTSIDYRYYAERGWLESDYYYPTRLGLFKRTAGRLMDAAVAPFRSMQ